MSTKGIDSKMLTLLVLCLVSLMTHRNLVCCGNLFNENPFLRPSITEANYANLPIIPQNSYLRNPESSLHVAGTKIPYIRNRHGYNYLSPASTHTAVSAGTHTSETSPLALSLHPDDYQKFDSTAETFFVPKRQSLRHQGVAVKNMQHEFYVPEAAVKQHLTGTQNTEVTNDYKLSSGIQSASADTPATNLQQGRNFDARLSAEAVQNGKLFPTIANLSSLSQIQPQRNLNKFLDINVFHSFLQPQPNAGESSSETLKQGVDGLNYVDANLIKAAYFNYLKQTLDEPSFSAANSPFQETLKCPMQLKNISPTVHTNFRVESASESRVKPPGPIETFKEDSFRVAAASSEEIPLTSFNFNPVTTRDTQHVPTKSIPNSYQALPDVRDPPLTREQRYQNYNREMLRTRIPMSSDFTIRTLDTNGNEQQHRFLSYEPHMFPQSVRQPHTVYGPPFSRDRLP